MIEAINSVLSNAPLLRNATEQVDTSRSQAVLPESTEQVALPKAPYISPFLSIDVNFDTTVLQIRDSDTGDVINQFPSESRLQERQRQAQAQQQTAERSEPVRQQTPQSTEQAAPQQEQAAPSAPAPSVPQAQAASAALTAAAQTSVQNLSAGVSVAA